MGAGPGIVVGMAYGSSQLAGHVRDSSTSVFAGLSHCIRLIGLAGLVKNLRVNRVVSILLAIAILVSGVIIFHYTMVSTAEVKTPDSAIGAAALSSEP